MSLENSADIAGRLNIASCVNFIHLFMYLLLLSDRLMALSGQTRKLALLA